MKIWLDDIRDAPDDSWTIVRDPYECIELLENGDVHELSLDHDLACIAYGITPVAEMTGYHVLLWIEEMASDNQWKLIPTKIGIHSANPVGRRKMQAAIDSIERMRNVGE